MVTLAGYGATRTDIDNTVLRFATLKIYSQRWCNHKYQQFDELPRQFTSDVLCAGYIVSFNLKRRYHLIETETTLSALILTAAPHGVLAILIIDNASADVEMMDG